MMNRVMLSNAGTVWTLWTEVLFYMLTTVEVGRCQRRLQEGGSGDGVLGSVPGRESDCTQVFQFN